MLFLTDFTAQNFVVVITLFILSFTAASLCNFENQNICGYTQDKRDKFDWRRSSGRTGSTGTGPPSDHTYQTNRGKQETSRRCCLTNKIKGTQ